MSRRKSNWMSRLTGFFASRAILFSLGAVFLAVSMIGVVGMSASVLVAESVRGSGSAINVAGSLRRLTHRVSALVVAEHLDGQIGRAAIDTAMVQFETSLVYPALLQVIERDSGSVADAIYRGIVTQWNAQLKPRMVLLVDSPARERQIMTDYLAMLDEVDAFVSHLDTLVTVLEHDVESRIRQLSTILAVALVTMLAVVVMAYFLIRRRVFLPLADLGEAAGRIARRDFTSRGAYSGQDELGQLGVAFNAMASELSLTYRDLEQRVEKKTADLRRSNRSLELLYHVISRLYHAPASVESYAETLVDIERVLGLKGSFACVQSKHGGPSNVLFSSTEVCGGSSDAQATRETVCLACPGRNEPWRYRRAGVGDELMVPLRDADNIYGMMRLMLERDQKLEPWQSTLIEAISRHMGVALGISRQTERERLLALQEERSVIARELHDSLAQALSYMKIQVSLLAPALNDPARRQEANAVLEDLRDGINAAYRQLRELLSSFRLQIEGDFSRLLSTTVEEFSNRSGVPIDLEIRLGASHLSPNQEIHALHIIREALSNATRHAGANSISVTLSARPSGEVSVVIDDDGKGIGETLGDGLHHYGLTIMDERARSLGGCLKVGQGPQGGTRVEVIFTPRNQTESHLTESIISLT